MYIGDWNFCLPLLALIQITKENVDRFDTRQEIPCCQITAEWTRQGKPSQLPHKLILNGAKKDNNYFYIELDTTPPDTKACELLAQAIYVLVTLLSATLPFPV